MASQMTGFEPRLVAAPNTAPVETFETSDALTDTVTDWAVPRTTLRLGVRYVMQALLTALPLIVADLVAISSAAGLVLGIGWLVDGSFDPRFAHVLLPFVAAVMVTNLCLGLYPGVGLSAAAEIRLTSLAVTLCTIVFLAATIVHDDRQIHTEVALLGMWALLLVVVPLLRRWGRAMASAQRWWGMPAVIFGGDSAGDAALRALLNNPSQGLRPVGVIDDLHRHWRDRHVEPTWFLGPPSSARRIAESRGAFWGIVAMPNRSAAEVAAVIDRHACTIPHLLVLPDMSGLGRAWDGAHDCGGLLGMRIDERLMQPSMRLAKRVMDLVLTLCGGLLISPILIGLAIATKMSSPGPIFYSQERIGRGGRRFRAWKFRSMVANADQVLAQYLERHPELRAEWQRDHKLKNDPRITRVGHLLRKTSLDELPQLWNVLRGDMSLVGPRPIVNAEIPKYADAFQLYLRVTPGITGLWQVSGRNNTTYEERVQFDTRYVRNWSPWMDLSILARTVKTVVFREGAY